jgi:hypothetical protein
LCGVQANHPCAFVERLKFSKFDENKNIRVPSPWDKNSVVMMAFHDAAGTTSAASSYQVFDDNQASCGCAKQLSPSLGVTIFETLCAADFLSFYHQTNF